MKILPSGGNRFDPAPGSKMAGADPAMRRKDQIYFDRYKSWVN